MPFRTTLGRSSRAANSASPRGGAEVERAQHPSFFFSWVARSLDCASRVREIVVELHQGDAGIMLLIGAGERHAELQQPVSRLRSSRIALVAFGKGGSGFGVLAASIKAFAEPILRIAGERVARMLLNKAAQRFLRRRIIRLPQQSESGIVLRPRPIRDGSAPPAPGGRSASPALATCGVGWSRPGIGRLGAAIGRGRLAGRRQRAIAGRRRTAADGHTA